MNTEPLYLHHCTGFLRQRISFKFCLIVIECLTFSQSEYLRSVLISLTCAHFSFFLWSWYLKLELHPQRHIILGRSRVPWRSYLEYIQDNCSANEHLWLLNIILLIFSLHLFAQWLVQYGSQLKTSFFQMAQQPMAFSASLNRLNWKLTWLQFFPSLTVCFL